MPKPTNYSTNTGEQQRYTEIADLKLYPGDRFFIENLEFEVTTPNRIYYVGSPEGVPEYIRRNVFDVAGYNLMEFFRATGFDMGTVTLKKPTTGGGTAKTEELDRLIKQVKQQMELP
jgi:hypothetical protein